MALGLFLLSAATLLLEIALTRLFSVALWYHFTFMVLSLAMLGFGASGTYLTLTASGKKNVPVSTAALFFSLSILLCLFITHAVPFDPLGLGRQPVQIFYMALYFFFFFIPFFFSGFVNAQFFKTYPEAPHRLYFLILSGSAAGCLLSPFLLSAAGQMRTVLFSSFLGIIAALCFTQKKRNLSESAFHVLLAIASLLIFLKPLPVFSPHIAESKFMGRLKTQFNASPVLTKWNSFSQIDAYEGGWVIYPPFLAGKNVSVPPQAALLIDGDAFTPVTQFHGNIKALSFLKQLPTTPVYFLKKNAKTCIIGSGGGIDVLSALYGGAKHITAVEINPLIVELTKNRYGKFSGNIYNNPKVNVVVDNGRTFMRRTNEKFDVIQMSLVDTWAASSSGALSLTENYLYTVEAFQEYLDHLTDDGIISITRWHTDPPLETSRVLSVAYEAMKRNTIKYFNSHILIIRADDLATVLVKKTPFMKQNILSFLKENKNTGLQSIYLPLDPGREIDFYELHRLSPVTDDSPFFFYFSSSIFPRRLPQGNALLQKSTMGSLALFLSLILTCAVSIALILFPLLAARKKQGMPCSRAPFFVYFFAIGCGYMFFEMVFLQKLTLFLGNPAVSLVTVISGLLFSSGAGSLAASSFTSKSQFQKAMLALCLFLLCDILFLSRFIHAFQGSPFAERLALSLCLIFPQGFLLGLPFPLGMKCAGKHAPELIPWAWSVNGFASVIAPVLATILAIHAGFSLVMILCLACYTLLFAAKLPDETTEARRSLQI